MLILFKQSRNLFKQSMRTYWSVKPKLFVSKSNKNYDYKYLSGNCGKQPLSRVEPYKQKFSKCIESYSKPMKKSRRYLFEFKKPPPQAKEKPTNCHTVELKNIKSWWKKLLGIKSKKSSSLSCICPITYQKQRMLRQKDPRLSDLCYQSTPGDVLIYTKVINAKKLEYHEPQPRLTPPYKVSRAALCKMIIADIEKTFCQCITAWSQNHDNCKHICKMNSIPFQEMRPSDKKKKAFTCRDGISTKEVIYPSNTANNFYIHSTNYHSIIK